MVSKEQDSYVQTPQEMEQAVSSLSDRTSEMDKADGIFGEALADEELDSVAGGDLIKTLHPMYWYGVCKQCGNYIKRTAPIDKYPFCSEDCHDRYLHTGKYALHHSQPLKKPDKPIPISLEKL